MLTTRQPDPDAPITNDQRLTAYVNALTECQAALIGTVEVLEDVAKLVLDYLNKPDDIDKDVVRDICGKAIQIAASTKDQFAIPDLDKTAGVPV